MTPLDGRVRDADLYHATSVTNLLEILCANRLGEQGSRVCFTRNLHRARWFANAKAEVVLEEWECMRYNELPDNQEPTEEEYMAVIPAAFIEQRLCSHEGAILVLDQTLLKQRYRIRPYNDGNGNDRGKWEMEERLEGRVVSPMESFVKAVIVGNAFERMSELLLHGSRRMSLMPQPQYEAAISFINSKRLHALEHTKMRPR